MAQLRRYFEGWQLFLLLALSITAAIVVFAGLADLRSLAGLKAVIFFSVRLALPFFILAFTASSLRSLWPSVITRWLLRNRRYFGLAFALGMTWHLVAVTYLLATFGLHLNRTALTADLVGLVSLVLLTVTSFQVVAKWISGLLWRRLHKVGVYTIWLLAMYIYAEALRGDRDGLHLTALLLLVMAWALRLSAWIRTYLAHRALPAS
jgi:methionine sulfoxide reductase heme-binding subunit